MQCKKPIPGAISQYFEQVKADFEATCYGCYFMEFADYYGQENLDASMMLNLLYASLLALGRESLPDRLVRYVFEIRLMVINGEYPQDLAEDEALPEAVRYTLYYAIHAPLQKLYTFVVRNEVLENIAKLQDQIREPEGFARMLENIIEKNALPEIPFLRKETNAL